MEKKLLSGAVLLFFLELTIFLADLGFLPFTLYSNNETISEQPSIGFVAKTRETVRKKSLNSIFWDATENNDTLNAFDSVLTLENSSAQLQLDNDIQLNLNGNTLVVLEPVQRQGERNFRIQFQKGNLNSRNMRAALEVTANEWTLDAKKGSEISITELADQNIQIEVTSGQAKLSHAQSAEKTTVSQGTRIAMNKNKVVEKFRISETLQWKHAKNLQKKYSFEFPTEVDLSWKGEAQKLRILQANHPPRWIDLKSGLNNYPWNFNAGTYFLTLQNENQTSPTLTVKVVPAHKTIYLNPLPRDRNDAKTMTDFRWLPNPDAHRYRVEVSNDINFQNVAFEKEVERPQLTTQVPITGSLYWRILTIDEQGFEVPAYYHYPLYNIVDPLSAPQLNAPIQRAPSQNSPDESHQNSSPLWQQFFELVIPKAYSAQVDAKKSVIFSWYEVPEADYYVIEISESKDFLNPIVVQKTKKTQFQWDEFKMKLYYYRVAAGQDSGRMGIFSSAAEVDLSLLASEVASKQLQPGVSLSIEKIKKELKVKEAATNQSKSRKTKRNSQPVAIKKIPTSTRKQPEELELSKSDQQWEFLIFWAAGYHMNSHASADSVNANQNAFSVKRFGAQLNIPLQSKGRLVAASEFFEVDWEPDSAQLPFQSPLKQKNYFHSLLYGTTASQSPYGIYAESIDIAAREGFENIKLNTIDSYGFLATTRYQFFSSWHTDHKLGLAYGNPYFILHSDNFVYYSMNYWGENSGQLGLEFNIKYGQGDSSINFISSQINLRLGFQF